MKKLTVNVDKGYDILIEKEITAHCGEYISKISKAKKVCIISDTNVFPLYGESVKASLKTSGFDVYEYIFTAGESSKKPAEIIKMVEFMAENEFTRSDITVALGGGVVGDMACLLYTSPSPRD